MTAPDSRDSVAIEFFHEADKLASSMAGIPAGPTRTALESEIVTLRKCARRLQALARGPQQAGGEDAPPCPVWLAGKDVSHAWAAGWNARNPHYAALQAEVARLLGQNERLAAAVRDTITRAETAEDALREGGRDAERWRTYERELPMSAGTVRGFVDSVLGCDAALNGGQDDA